MKTAIKILFSPIIIAYWVVKGIARLLTFPVAVIWRILTLIMPELTRPLTSLFSGLLGIVRR